MSLVSIIMSVFNVEKTLREALDSLIAQTYADWECIICDDGSSDGTWKILEEYSERFPGRFILLKNEQNCGLAYSLNRCLKRCQGEFVARMDGDDISEPERLEREVLFLQSHHECQLVGTQMMRFDEKGGEGILTVKERPALWDWIRGVPFCHATIMMRREVYEVLGGYDAKLRRSEDYDLWFRFFAKGYRGYNLQQAYYRYRENLVTVKRRTLSNRLEFMRVQYRGYRLIGIPWWAYIWPILNCMKFLIPSRLVLIYRRWQSR